MMILSYCFIYLLMDHDVMRCNHRHDKGMF